MRWLIVGLLICMLGGENQTIQTPAQNEQQFKSTMAEMLEHHNAVDLNDSEIEELAHIVNAEARGEPFKGKQMVVAVILNRVNDERFPDSVHNVIYQKNAFTPVNNGSINKQPSAECYEAVDSVITGEWDYLTESKGALYFESGSSWHQSHLSYLFKIGNHRFYR